ncbi:MAG: NAD(P)/FAD-dependent oxidoreductase [Rikenellaceae bacterium]|nr:NAD(P)/FAD-dependent oxidoreductase [Rikenellaceae bacterium]
MRDYDVVVIGAGAAGLMAAATSARNGNRTVILEKMEKPARKVRITGKGRCNITNTRSLEEFRQKIKVNADFVMPSLISFSNEDTVKFFESEVVKLNFERGGRVFPASGKAWDVADALVNFARKNGAEIKTYSRVNKLKINDNKISGVEVVNKNGKKSILTAANVILATGGASYPSTGSTGDGYTLAHGAGHNIIDIRPSLTPLVIANKYKTLNGLLLKNISASLIIDGNKIWSEFGEMEFIDGTASGAAILKLSRNAVDAVSEGSDVSISLDLKPALSIEKLKGRIKRELEKLRSGGSLRIIIEKLLPRKMVNLFISECGFRPDIKPDLINETIIEGIVSKLKNWEIRIVDYCPFTHAIVTAVGVDTDEINPDTMQSKLVEGLYFAGEIIDVDADTGGYNLQIAFSTGKLAGELKK